MRRLLAGILLLPALASAAGRDDFARQWPLILSRPDAGAYRVVLDGSVYRHAQDAGLRDVAVLDRDGNRVPAAVEIPSTPAAAPSFRPVPWFGLPAPDATTATGGWSLRTEAAPDGRLRNVELRSGGDAGASPPVPGALLLDLTGLAAPVAFVDLAWRPGGPVDVGVRIEGSDDLEHWSAVASRGRLLELHQDGRRLVQRRIELPDTPRLRYLRVLPDPPGALPAVLDARAAPRPPQVDAAPHWLDLAPVRSAEGGTVFEFALDDRVPVSEVDVALPGAHAVQWRLASREDARRPWRPRVADWLGYRVAAGERSPPRGLGHAVRDRHWQLRAGAPVAGTPRLRLGYRPEALVFVAQGRAPYTLVAGSARPPGTGGAASVIAALRAAQPPGWQPAVATLGAGRERAGDAALRPVRDWRTWLLWGVLGLGAALVAGFAAHVLRTARPVRG